jgi:predicted pyridoxine 5'-phosphate oxidase superfamily flavin-nucleotide-binding protein
MARIPQVVFQALQQLDTPAVFTTVDSNGNPNSAYVMLVKTDNPEIVLLNDSVFHKTRENIMTGSRGAVVFLTAEHKAYQIKGALKYHTSGPLFDHMRRVVDVIHARVAAVELVVDEVYEGADKLL